MTRDTRMKPYRATIYLDLSAPDSDGGKRAIEYLLNEAEALGLHVAATDFYPVALSSLDRRSALRQEIEEMNAA